MQELAAAGGLHCGRDMFQHKAGARTFVSGTIAGVIDFAAAAVASRRVRCTVSSCAASLGSTDSSTSLGKSAAVASNMCKS